MNFIIFMPDELRAESMGCYGHPLDVTPNLDAFAAQGTRFDQCYVQHTVCSPSRCSMLTGWYPHVRGHRTLWHLLRPDEPNLFRYLREAGYDVHWFGKNDALSPESFASSVNEAGSKGRGYPFGPSPWSPEDPQYYSFLHEPWADSLDHHSDQANVQAAIDILRNRSGTADRPFVLYLPLIYPHCPYSAPEPWHSRFQPEQVVDGLRPADLPRKPSFHSGMRELRRLDQCTEDLFAKVNAVYLGMTAFNDHLFGRLMDELEASPFRDDTTVLYLSDHGDYAGDYGLVEKWPSAAEDVITRVPLIIRTPGGREGHVVAEQVELFDIMPTILGLAGVEARHTHFARDLTPQLHGGTGDPDRMVFTEGGYDPHEPHCFEGRNEDWGELHPYWPKLTLQQRDAGTIGRTATVRTSTHKLTRRNGDISELYDLVGDPLETVNLIDQPEHQGIQRELELVLLDWYLTTSDVTPFDENPRGHTFRSRS